MPARSERIQTYIHAKDENRPHLMKFAFAETAKLRMAVETDTISFPPLTDGIDAITQVLRDFGQVYENVYTFCLGDPPKGNVDKYTCPWIDSRDVGKRWRLSPRRLWAIRLVIREE
jgi:hypothetical protein